MSIMRWCRVFAFSSIAWLTACAISPPVQEGMSITTAFERSGRFAISVDRFSGGHDAVQGGFQWRETEQQLWLDLVNPMGSILARVEVDASGALLRYPNGEVKYAPTPDVLVEQLLGYAIPVEEMRQWLRGQTGAAPTLVEQIENGQMQYFEQNGWRVRMQRYDDLGPRLLQMNRNQSQNTISVRVVVDY